MKTIQIIVSPAGQTRLETKGFTGTTCHAASKFLEQAMGRKLSEGPTAEAHQAVRHEAEEREEI